MRSIENKEEKEREYEDNLVDAYLRKYTNLAKEMAMNYKRQAINAYLTETYCGDDNPKYAHKYRDLIEKALYSSKGWHKLRNDVLLVGELRKDKIDTSVPFSIKKAVEELHKHFKEYLDFSDLEELTVLQIKKYGRESPSEFESSHAEPEIDYGSLPEEDDVEGLSDLSD